MPNPSFWGLKNSVEKYKNPYFSNFLTNRRTFSTPSIFLWNKLGSFPLRRLLIPTGTYDSSAGMLNIPTVFTGNLSSSRLPLCPTNSRNASAFLAPLLLVNPASIACSRNAMILSIGSTPLGHAVTQAIHLVQSHMPDFCPSSFKRSNESPSSSPSPNNSGYSSAIRWLNCKKKQWLLTQY